MKLKDVNCFFGYTHFAVGATKGFLLFLMGLQLLSAVTSGNLGNTSFDSYETLGQIIGFVQIGLAMTSILMILINIPKQPNVIWGYVLGILAISIELSVSGLFHIFFLLPECYLYMEAGKKITKNCSKKDSIYTY